MASAWALPMATPRPAAANSATSLPLSPQRHHVWMEKPSVSPGTARQDSLPAPGAVNSSPPGPQSMMRAASLTAAAKAGPHFLRDKRHIDFQDLLPASDAAGASAGSPGGPPLLMECAEGRRLDPVPCDSRHVVAAVTVNVFGGDIVHAGSRLHLRSDAAEKDLRKGRRWFGRCAPPPRRTKQAIGASRARGPARGQTLGGPARVATATMQPFAAASTAASARPGRKTIGVAAKGSAGPGPEPAVYSAWAASSLGGRTMQKRLPLWMQSMSNC